MLQRVTAIFLGLLLLIFSQLTYAVGLGSIHLFSDLNEPLYAEIEILDSDKVTMDELSASLASEQIFEDTGVEYLSYLSKLEFKLLEGPHGKVIQISTETPVSQPYYNFLVEMRWTQGHLSRQYTLLLDPKGFPAHNPAKGSGPSVREQVEAIQDQQKADKQQKAEQSSAQAANLANATAGGDNSPAVSNPEAVATQPQTASQVAPAVPESTNTAPVMQFASKYGPVSAHEQLWRIARKVKPKGVSLEQTIMSVYYANEAAFSHQNINLLQKGQVLNIPVAEEMANIPQSEAKKELVQHIRNWRSGAYMQVNSVVSPASTATANTHTANATKESPQAPPAPEKQSAPITPAAQSENTASSSMPVMAPVKNPPGPTLSSSATLPVIPSFSDNAQPAGNNGNPQIMPIESHGLESNKVQLASSGDVNETINTLQAELAVTAQNLKMAEQQSQQMKLKFEDLDHKSSQLQQQIEEKDKLLLQLQQQLESEHGAAKPNVVKQNTADEPTKPISKDKNTSGAANNGANANAPKTSSQASVNEMPASAHSLSQLIILFAVVLAAGLLGFYFWKLRSARKNRDSIKAVEDPHLDSDDIQAAKVAPVKTQEQKAQPQTKLVDPFEEATVYLAYNRHSQAEKVLLDGLRDHPDREDFKVLLLEVYSSLGDRQQFAIWDSTLDSAELEASRPDLYAKVVKMRALVTGEKPVETLAPAANISATPVPPPTVSTAVSEPVAPKPVAISTPQMVEPPKSIESSAAAKATAPVKMPEPEPTFETESEQEEKGDTIAFEFTKIEAKPAKAAEAQPKAQEAEEEDEGGGLLAFESVAITAAPIKSAPAPQKTASTAQANGPLELMDEELSNEMQFDGVSDPEEELETEIEYKTSSKNLTEEFSIGAVPEEDEGLQAGAPWQAESNETGDCDGQLDLAIAYIEIEDFDGAKDLLNLVASKGDNFQQKRANELLAELASKGY